MRFIGMDWSYGAGVLVSMLGTRAAMSPKFRVRCGKGVVQWHSGTGAQWHSSTGAQGHSGTVAQGHSGTVAQWHSGTVAQWHSGTVAQWHSGTVVFAGS
jgi:hypothetical protein